MGGVAPIMSPEKWEMKVRIRQGGLACQGGTRLGFGKVCAHRKDMIGRLLLAVAREQTGTSGAGGGETHGRLQEEGGGWRGEDGGEKG